LGVLVAAEVQWIDVPGQLDFVSDASDADALPMLNADRDLIHGHDVPICLDARR
jgi:hypothetical protein